MKTHSTVCNSHITRQSTPGAEVLLWGAKLNVMIQDALTPFKLPCESVPSLEKQYTALIKKRARPTKSLRYDFNAEKYRLSHDTRQTVIDHALYFFESEAFDHCLGYVGRENQVDAIFRFIQRAVTLRKKYNVFMMKEQMKKSGIKISNLDEAAQQYIRWR